MKARHLLVAAVAAFALGGCVTYDTTGASAPGGYYHGRASSNYYYGDYGYGYPYGYYGYGYYGYGYPYYRYPYSYPRPPSHPGGHGPRPPAPGGDHGNNGPRPPSSGGGDRSPPWRRPGDFSEENMQRPTPPRPDSGSRINVRQVPARQPASPSQPQRVQQQPSQPRSVPRVSGGNPARRSAPAPVRAKAVSEREH